MFTMFLLIITLITEIGSFPLQKADELVQQDPRVWKELLEVGTTPPDDTPDDTERAREGKELLEVETESQEAVTADIKVMTYNLYGWNALERHEDTDGKNMMKAINKHQPDFLGTEETQGYQKWILNKVPGYEALGSEEHGLAIFYKIGDWESVDEGKIKLRSRDKWGQRIARWGRFRNRVTENSFYFFVSHFCVCSSKDLADSASEVADEITARRKISQYPAIFVGDLNVFSGFETSKAVRYLKGNYTDGDHGTTPVTMIDTFRTANPTGKYSSFGSAGIIDFIMATQDVQVLSSVIDTDAKGSDHKPVISELRIGGELTGIPPPAPPPAPTMAPATSTSTSTSTATATAEAGGLCGTSGMGSHADWGNKIKQCVGTETTCKVYEKLNNRDDFTTCDGFCASFSLKCTAAFKDKADYDCTEGTSINCDDDDGHSSDHICQCEPTSDNSPPPAPESEPTTPPAPPPAPESEPTTPPAPESEPTVNLCADHIKWAMSSGRYQNPEWYAEMEEITGEALKDATFEDFQLWFKCTGTNSEDCTELPATCSNTPCACPE